MSSTYRSKLGADNCIDGDVGGKACHTKCGVQSPWLEVDLGAKFDLDFVVLHNRPGRNAMRLGEYEIWVSDQQGQRTERCVSASVPESSRELQLQHPCVASGRFVTLVLPGSDRCLNLMELRLLSRTQQAGAFVPQVAASLLAPDDDMEAPDGVSAPDWVVVGEDGSAAPASAAEARGQADAPLWSLTWLEVAACAAVLALWTALLWLCWRCCGQSNKPRARAPFVAHGKAPVSGDGADATSGTKPAFKRKGSSLREIAVGIAEGLKPNVDHQGLQEGLMSPRKKNRGANEEDEVVELDVAQSRKNTPEPPLTPPPNLATA